MAVDNGLAKFLLDTRDSKGNPLRGRHFATNEDGSSYELLGYATKPCRNCHEETLYGLQLVGDGPVPETCGREGCDHA